MVYVIHTSVTIPPFPPPLSHSSLHRSSAEQVFGDRFLGALLLSVPPSSPSPYPTSPAVDEAPSRLHSTMRIKSAPARTNCRYLADFLAYPDDDERPRLLVLELLRAAASCPTTRTTTTHGNCFHGPLTHGPLWTALLRLATDRGSPDSARALRRKTGGSVPMGSKSPNQGGSDAVHALLGARARSIVAVVRGGGYYDGANAGGGESRRRRSGVRKESGDI